MKFFLVISFLFLATFSLSEKTTYVGYKLVILSVNDKALIEKVHSFEEYDTEVAAKLSVFVRFIFN